MSVFVVLSRRTKGDFASQCVGHSGFQISASRAVARNSPNPNPAQKGRNRPHRARGKLEVSKGASITCRLGWQAEVGDPFGHLEALKVPG